MKLKIGYILLILMTFAFKAKAENIKGFAPDYVGQKVELYTYQDYITLTLVKLGEGLVSEKDSMFSIDVEIGLTIKGLLQIGKTEAPLYLAPETDYQLYFPKARDQAISFQNLKTEVMFYGLDSTDINYRILQYNQWFDSYIAYHESDIARGQFLAYLDTFKIYSADAYADVKDEYFLTYVRFNIAEMEQTFGGNSKSASRLNTFLNSIEPFPVYYENDQYMSFFRGFYSKNFNDYIPDVEARINMAIYNASPTKLMLALKMDVFLSNPEIRETVMIDQLGKQYYMRNDQKRSILIMLDSLSNFASTQVNATTAKNVKLYLTSLEPGFPAPQIKFEKEGVDPLTWKSYRGKFVYLNFFETWNDQAKTDMQIIEGLKKKYGEYVSFISICTDEKKVTFDNYVRDHKELDWDIFYEGRTSSIKTDFRVKIVPSYYLIDQSGFIAISPAPSPAPDGEYESIDKTFFYIKKALTEPRYNGIGRP